MAISQIDLNCICVSPCIVQWSVTTPGQDWLELNPDVKPVKHPAEWIGLEAEVRAERVVLI